jgi:hypothetical protein
VSCSTIVRSVYRSRIAFQADVFSRVSSSLYPSRHVNANGHERERESREKAPERHQPPKVIRNDNSGNL